MAIATLGYGSRTQAITALRKKGMTTREIADEIGISPNNVTALEASITRKPRSSETHYADDRYQTIRMVPVPAEILALLASAARRRDMSREQLAREIIEKVAEDRLVDAVLDDAEELRS